MCFTWGSSRHHRGVKSCINTLLRGQSHIFCFSSFKHLIGGLEDVTSKGHEDADAKAK